MHPRFEAAVSARVCDSPRIAACAGARECMDVALPTHPYTIPDTNPHRQIRMTIRA